MKGKKRKMTPIQSKINEIEQECLEFGNPLNISLWELKTNIREYAEKYGLGSIQLEGGK